MVSMLCTGKDLESRVHENIKIKTETYKIKLELEVDKDIREKKDIYRIILWLGRFGHLIKTYKNEEIARKEYNEYNKKLEKSKTIEFNFYLDSPIKIIED